MNFILLREAARKKKLTGKELASKMQVTPETVSRHMNGKTEPSNLQIKKYAKILEIDPRDLIFEKSSIDEENDYGIEVLGDINHNRTIDLREGRDVASVEANIKLGSKDEFGCFHDNKSETLVIVKKIHFEEKKVLDSAFENLSIISRKSQKKIKLAVLSKLQATGEYFEIDPYNYHDKQCFLPEDLE
tara:strand:+ start:1156 stop:1719 length:564 start_codon:yes stop_codon:yes gene_type:complete